MLFEHGDSKYPSNEFAMEMAFLSSLETFSYTVLYITHAMWTANKVLISMLDLDLSIRNIIRNAINRPHISHTCRGSLGRSAEVLYLTIFVAQMKIVLMHWV